jgi:hypothetical protein
MKGKFSATNLPYVSKIWAIIVYFILLISVNILFLGRKTAEVRIPFLVDLVPFFYSHVSNFVLSFMICMVSGFMEILSTKKSTFTKAVAGFLILGNFVYEGYIPILNTTDTVDAYFGLVGAILPFVFFYFFKKWGLKANPNYLA